MTLPESSELTEASCLGQPAKRKTKLCSFFPLGCCERGNACTFAHGEGELSSNSYYKTRMCRSLLRDGECASATCGYAHSISELRVGTEPGEARDTKLPDVRLLPTNLHIPTRTCTSAEQHGLISDRGQLPFEGPHVQEEARPNEQRVVRQHMLQQAEVPRQQRPSVRMRQCHVFVSDDVSNEETHVQELCRKFQRLSLLDQLALMDRLSKDLTWRRDHEKNVPIRPVHNHLPETMLEAAVRSHSFWEVGAGTGIAQQPPPGLGGHNRAQIKLKELYEESIRLMEFEERTAAIVATTNYIAQQLPPGLRRLTRSRYGSSCSSNDRTHRGSGSSNSSNTSSCERHFQNLSL